MALRKKELLKKEFSRELSEAGINGTDARLTANGKVCCLVCQQRPVFGSVAELVNHRATPEHARALQAIEASKAARLSGQYLDLIKPKASGKANLKSVTSADGAEKAPTPKPHEQETKGEINPGENGVDAATNPHGSKPAAWARAPKNKSPRPERNRREQNGRNPEEGAASSSGRSSAVPSTPEGARAKRARQSDEEHIHATHAALSSGNTLPRVPREEPLPPRAATSMSSRASDSARTRSSSARPSSAGHRPAVPPTGGVLEWLKQPKPITPLSEEEQANTAIAAAELQAELQAEGLALKLVDDKWIALMDELCKKKLKRKHMRQEFQQALIAAGWVFEDGDWFRGPEIADEEVEPANETGVDLAVNMDMIEALSETGDAGAFGDMQWTSKPTTRKKSDQKIASVKSITDKSFFLTG